MIRFIALGGFLGAGKTTTILAAAKQLEAQGRAVAVITNDQGTSLVDTKLVRSQLDAVAEVTGGCFCCRFEDLMTVADRLLADATVDTVIAEAVGSCTDLQATVLRPLRKYYGDRFQVAPLTTIVDPQRLRGFALAAERGEPESDMSYLFGHQLAEADVVAVNKNDLLGASERDELVSRLRDRYPNAKVLAYSAKTTDGLDALLQAWDESPTSATVDIDYDRYAAAEAELAWFNNTYSIAADSGFSASVWARVALQSLAEAAAAAGWMIGHAKIAVETNDGLTKMSVTEAGAAPTVDVEAGNGQAQSGMASLNARIRCEPAELDAAGIAAVKAADAAAGTTSSAVAGTDVSFKPGYPTPTHRLLDATV